MARCGILRAFFSNGKISLSGRISIFALSLPASWNYPSLLVARSRADDDLWDMADVDRTSKNLIFARPSEKACLTLPILQK
jgi:hypothetical protein